MRDDRRRRAGCGAISVKTGELSTETTTVALGAAVRLTVQAAVGEVDLEVAP